MPKFFESWQRWKQLFRKKPAVPPRRGPWPFKQITIRIVPQDWMREQYREAYGDYYLDERGNLVVMVREYENPDFAFGCVLHELVEAWRCYRDGISLESIEAFDAIHADHFDPGRIPQAPYHKQHMQSMDLERLFAEQDGYSWAEYDAAEPIGGVR